MRKLVISLLLVTPSLALTQGGPGEEISFSNSVAPHLKNYCVTCHSGPKPKGGIDFSAFDSQDVALYEPTLWKKVLERINSSDDPMPPMWALSAPSGSEVEDISSWILKTWPEFGDTSSTVADEEEAAPSLGLRRLNRAEYINSVEDIFGDSFGVYQVLPDDPIGKLGFDNNSETLGFSRSIMTSYMVAAERIANSIVQGAGQDSKIITCQPQERDVWQSCLREIVSPIIERFHRRSYSHSEIESVVTNLYAKLSPQSDSFKELISRALASLLISPEFLIRIETGNPETGELSNMQLAHRLSYFLWSRLPDEELLAAASSGRLSSDQELRAQALRMIDSPKFDGFIENFGGYWLGFRLIAFRSLDKELFPEFTPAIQTDMRMEAKLFFEDAIRSGKSLQELINTNETFVNQRLAEYYGIPGEFDEQFRKVRVDDGSRGGILTHGAFLVLNSGSTETSPVRRGKWILENLLCSAPPPPPAGVNTTINADDQKRLNPKELLALHRENKVCASCHNVMDPVGLPFENYSASGKWRDAYRNGDSIEIAEKIFNDLTVNSAHQLKEFLSSDVRYPSCFVNVVTGYALGRGMNESRSANQGIVEAIQNDDLSIKDILIEVILSEQFRRR